PWRNAARTATLSSGVLARMNPITGIAVCCARAASGHAVASPTSEMNSRRLLDHLVSEREQRERDVPLSKVC
ncbi:MAG TPA: hypothetical protein VE178_17360, partial [Silvibacterium sp.]|nr:hypothetical protein [Silvibacterium sp.]